MTRPTFHPSDDQITEAALYHAMRRAAGGRAMVRPLAAPREKRRRKKGQVKPS